MYVSKNECMKSVWKGTYLLLIMDSLDSRFQMTLKILFFILVNTDSLKNEHSFLLQFPIPNN